MSAKNPKKKGRAFELSVYNELVKFIPSIRLSKWSGSSDEPADLFGNHVTIEVKHVNKCSDNKIFTWFKHLQDEAPLGHVPVLIIRKTSQKNKVYLHARDLGITVDDIAMFNWSSGKMLIKMLEEGNKNGKTCEPPKLPALKCQA